MDPMEKLMLQKYVHQLRPRNETYTPHVDKIQNFLFEQNNLPSEVFGGLPHEKNERQSSSKMDIIIVRSKDRDTDRDEILRNLNQAGIPSQLNTTIQSGVAPIDGTHDGKKFRISVKPVSGGMQETTLNSSITELFPCIAFENNYRPSNVENFMEFLMSVNVNDMNCIHSKDKEAAKETINKAESSSKYETKMENAIGITQYLYDTSNDKPIDSVYWGYRSSSKPKGVPGNHPGDVFIKFAGPSVHQFLGVSLKAGGKKTKEPQLNTYVRPVWKFFNADRNLETLRSTAYAQIYSKIKGVSPIANFDGGKTGRHRDKSKTATALVNYNKKDSKGYESDYDSMLEIMRTGIIDLFNKSKSKSLDYIKTNILRDAPDVPTIVIKAVGLDYAEVTDRDELGVFLPQVQFVRAYASTTSKQNWVLELKSGTESVNMLMTIRSNKSGNAGQKKLGQFPTGLAVKYNGLAK